MGRRFRGEHAGLLFIFILEAIAFSGAFAKFFNHDSLFYLVYAPRSWDQFMALLAGPDPTQQYRPMTLALMSVLSPFFRLNFVAYHWIPLAFHLLNTFLFWLLARRLLSSPLPALAATAFWGLHSAAAFVTYDIGYFPDFLMATFAVASLIFAVDAQRSGRRLKILFALLLYACALLCKEAAVALPAAVLICLVLAPRRDADRLPGLREFLSLVRKALPVTGAYLAIALIHAGRLFLWLQAGRLYSQGSGQPYDIGLFGNFAAKAGYFLWALNLPDRPALSQGGREQILAILMTAFLFLVWFLNIALRKGRLLAAEVGGILWLPALLVPAFLLSNRTEKWYLYVPVMGLALAIGAGWPRGQWRRIPAAPAGMAIFLAFAGAQYLSTSVLAGRVLNSSDSAYVSGVVQNCVRDFERIYPSLPSDTTLFLLSTGEKNVAQFFGGGELYSLFYPGKKIRMLFADRGDRLPEESAGSNQVRILRFLYGHVYDVTAYYEGRRSRSLARRVVDTLDAVNFAVDRREFYPDYATFDTPNGQPVFFATPDHDILTQIGGSQITVPMGRIPNASRLRLDVSWMHDQGDGGWAELAIRTARGEDVLFKKYLPPNPQGRGLDWHEVVLDLDSYAGSKADLLLTCRNKQSGNTIADWLNWRDIQLVSPNLTADTAR
jgi:hypothetical protein